MPTQYELKAAAKAERRRARGNETLRACGLPTDHPLLVLDFTFLAGLRPMSHYNYAAHHAAFFGWCIDERLDPLAITRVHGKQYLTSLTKLRPASQAVRIAAIRSLYEEARAEGITTLNPFLKVRPKGAKRSSRRTPFLTEDQLAEALRLAAARIGGAHDLVALRNYVLVYTGARIGLRREEYSGLSVGDLSGFGDSVLLDVTGKGGTQMQMPVPSDVDDVLDYWLERLSRAIGRPLRKDDALFPVVGQGDFRISRHDPGEPLPALTPEGVTDVVKKVFTDAGFVGPRYASHVLRATAATLAWKHGANRFDVMTLLRHAEPTMADRYINGASEESAAERWRPKAPMTPAEMRAIYKPRRRRRSRTFVDAAA